MCLLCPLLPSFLPNSVGTSLPCLLVLAPFSALPQQTALLMCSCKRPAGFFSQTELQRGTHKRLAGRHREEPGSPSLTSHSPQLPRAASTLSCSSSLYSHILVLAPPAWPCSGYPDILPWAPELHQQEQLLAEASPELLLCLLLALKLLYTLYTQFTCFLKKLNVSCLICLEHFLTQQ